MQVTVGNVVDVDMSKHHHLLVVQSKKHDVIHVSCVDCDEAREYAFDHLAALADWLADADDYQVLSWINVDARQ